MAIQREGELIPSSVSLPENLLPRRNFLQVASLIGLSVILDACAPPSLARKLATATSTLAPNPTDKIPPTQTDVATQIPIPKEPTPKAWELSLAQRVELMANPEFFTKLQGKNTRKIITLQSDDSEYIGENRELSHVKSCGQSALATLVKMFEYLKTGIVPDITIAGVDAALDGKTFLDINGKTVKYIDKDGTMRFVGLGDAAKLLIPQYISETRILTPNHGAYQGKIFPQEYWPGLLSKAQVICELAGITIPMGSLYGGPHIVIGTDVKEDGTALVVDSYSGTAERVLLKNYFETRVNPEVQSVRRQTVLYCMIGVIPKLNASS